MQYADSPAPTILTFRRGASRCGGNGDGRVVRLIQRSSSLLRIFSAPCGTKSPHIFSGNVDLHPLLQIVHVYLDVAVNRLPSTDLTSATTSQSSTVFRRALKAALEIKWIGEKYSSLGQYQFVPMQPAALFLNYRGALFVEFLRHECHLHGILLVFEYVYFY